MRHRLRHPRPSSSTILTGPMTGGTIYYGGWQVLPEVSMVPEGELFGRTWIIRRCCFGRPRPDGYEVRCLLGDNDHYATRREAVHAAFLRAMRTIELDGVGAVHLCAIPGSTLDLGVR